MHRGLVSCAAGAPLAEVCAALVEHRTHTVMVLREDSLAFVTDMDLVAAGLHNEPAATAGEMANSGFASIGTDAALDRAAVLVAETAIRHVVAVDDDGFPVGVVSTLDVVGAIADGCDAMGPSRYDAHVLIVGGGGTGGPWLTISPFGAPASRSSSAAI
jgi:CBS domain-containing protein